MISERTSLFLHPTVQRFEYGTQNDALFYGLGTAIDFVQTIGPDRIWRHNHALAERFYQGLQAIPGVEIVSPQEEAYRSAMISFRMKNYEFTRSTGNLAKERIRVRTVTEGGVELHPGLLPHLQPRRGGDPDSGVAPKTGRLIPLCPMAKDLIRQDRRVLPGCLGRAEGREE